MAIIKAFKGLRPTNELAEKVASPPYDVLNSAEAREMAAGNTHSFLHVIKPEIALSEDIDIYDEKVYQEGRNQLERLMNEGVLVQDEKDCIYVYRQIMHGIPQVGIVACSHIDDYFNDTIKKHEYTRPVKEKDRIKHMETLSAHPGPVFLTYNDVDAIDTIVNETMNTKTAVNDFTASDGVQHTLWIIDDENVINHLELLFNERVEYTYIADGHHRAASSAKVGAKLREQKTDYDGTEEFNYFLSVLFPANQLRIIDYNRLVTDLNGLSNDDFLNRLKDQFTVETVAEQYKPQNHFEYGMYMDNQWYKCVAKEGTYPIGDPVKSLDISVLSDNVIAPILGIVDQRTDNRIDFVGGIRGLGELEKRVNSSDMKLAFSIYPVSIQQLIDIANTGNVMPPKTTWFEPKLRSGLVTHLF